MIFTLNFCRPLHINDRLENLDEIICMATFGLFFKHVCSQEQMQGAGTMRFLSQSDVHVVAKTRLLTRCCADWADRSCVSHWGQFISGIMEIMVWQVDCVTSKHESVRFHQTADGQTVGIFSYVYRQNVALFFCSE